MAAAMLVSGFSFGPVAAEEEESSSEFVEVSAAEETISEEPSGDVELARDSLYHYSIYSMDDLEAALGAENVSVISDTEIQLTTDVDFEGVRDEPTIYDFFSGPYVIDFNGHRINGDVSFNCADGAELTLKDSTGTNTGGVSNLILVELNAVAPRGFPIRVYGGKMTILSGKYVGAAAAVAGFRGELRIEGGIFENEAPDFVTESTAVVIMAGMTKAEITGGTFTGETAGLMCMKESLAGSIMDSPLRISGGTFVATSDVSYAGGILYYSMTEVDAPDLYEIIEEDCYLIPDTIRGFAEDDDHPSLSCTERSVTVVNPEGITNFANNLYTQALGRNPSESSKRSLVMQLYNGEVTGVDTAYKYVFSPEALSKNLSDEAFVTLLYKVFLNRTPDSVGKQIWLSALTSGATRFYVFAGFARSTEWKDLCSQSHMTPGSYSSADVRDQNINLTAFVTRLYKLCLNREPDLPGLTYWITGLSEKKLDGAHVAFGFYFSKELGARNLSDDAFIAILYQGLLGRTPDSTGRAFWNAQLNGGASRLEVFRGFVHSAEFEAICKGYGIVRGEI